MRRVEIINAIDRIVGALAQSDVQAGVRSLLLVRDQSRMEPVTRAIKAIHQFGLLAANFGEAERFILDALKLGMLLDSDQWTAMLLDPKVEKARGLGRSIIYATEFLPRLKVIIEPDYQQAVINHGPGIPKVLQGKTLLTVIAIEEHDQFSGPQRLIEVMQSITLFYEALAILENQSADDLIILTCDSGSDKSFDFLGAARLMEQVRELILSLWDKVVFFRERKAAERIELVAKSLPVIEQIARLRESGALIPEKAEIVSRKLLEGVEKFLRNGATIPEIRNASTFNPRALLAPQTKLLMDVLEEPSSGDSEPSAPSDDPVNKVGELSAEEATELRRLVAKLGNDTPHSEKSTERDSDEESE